MMISKGRAGADEGGSRAKGSSLHAARVPRAVRGLESGFAHGRWSIAEAGSPARARFAGRALAIGAGLTAGLLGIVSPGTAAACTDASMQEALAISRSWPEGEADRFGADDVISVYLRIQSGLTPVLELLRIEVVDEADGSAVAGQAQVHPVYGRDHIWWRPATPLRVGGRYHYAVHLSEDGPVAAEATFVVAPGPEPTPSLDGITATWCARSNRRIIGCNQFDSCDYCYEPILGPAEPEFRVAFEHPDAADTAHSGRWVELRAASGAWTSSALWQLGTAELAVPAIPGNCVDLRIQGVDGAAATQIQRCAPETVAPCVGEAIPDAGPSEPLDGGGADAGDPHSDASVAKSDGCQAGPGAPGVPLVAGLFALLLGRPRRHRRG